MSHTIQIVVDHVSASFAGERSFTIYQDTAGFSASCPGFGSSRFYASPIEAVLALVADNGGSEASSTGPSSPRSLYNRKTPRELIALASANGVDRCLPFVDLVDALVNRTGELNPGAPVWTHTVDDAPDPSDPAYWTPEQRAEAEAHVSGGPRWGPNRCRSSECHCPGCSA